MTDKQQSSKDVEAHNTATEERNNERSNDENANTTNNKEQDSFTSEYNPHSLKLDIIASTLILCMSILFLVASSSMKQKSYILEGSYTVASFYLSTSITYALFVGIELYKRNDVGTFYILMACMGIPSSVAWMIGSCYLFKSHFDYLKFGLCWIIGSILDLCFCVSKHLKHTSWFLKLSLVNVFLANVQIIIGVSIMIANYKLLYREHDCEKRYDDMDNLVWVCLNQDVEEDVSLKRFYIAMNFMIAASIFYILYACFYILHMFVDRGIGSVKEVNLEGGCKNDKVER
ncbi:predicted protein [Chaetoceros tenuissimus]|uniref:Uncharacterized protein n=1 Tax=Chaetoceros tenuissimus TaxID=426638 RepID=A0AAD3D3A6_9STRA|nr:predicted protein [Chaetoceros tenuissimus]